MTKKRITKKDKERIINYLVERGELELPQAEVLATIFGSINERLTLKERPSVYYGPINHKDLAVHFLTNEYNSKIEDKIYHIQDKIISEYRDSDIDFRLIPKYKVAEKKLIPPGFKKLAFI